MGRFKRYESVPTDAPTAQDILDNHAAREQIALQIVTELQKMEEDDLLKSLEAVRRIRARF